MGVAGRQGAVAAELPSRRPARDAVLTVGANPEVNPAFPVSTYSNWFHLVNVQSQLVPTR
ncbi:hypothetical protein GCM10009687_66810 [Asanoa iriomotensis]|uniref:Uncharacterized protein n=1 Tax=Asanoa iriomotensis TaxID=234613 RepID=A0ABQ4C476_9ACTN|nr:hypothetical protein Air01nite_36780 [Asanoa iriomotensis]